MLAVGCASINLTERHRHMGTEKIAKPERIYVNICQPMQIFHPGPRHQKNMPNQQPLTPEKHEIGRKPGGLVAKELVMEI